MALQPVAPDGPAGPRSSGPACLAADEAIRFLQGRLAADELARVESHVDRCPTCLQYVAELTEASAAYDVPASGLGPGGDAATELDVGGPGASPGDGLEGLLRRHSSLERYVIDRLLGSGGMGVVYAAYDPKLDRKVALKVLHGATAGRHEAKERLLREARAMARLSHPNVVAVYDVGVHDERLFLTMEYVDGVTLRAWLWRDERAPREVLRAFVQAGQGLAAAHAVGVVHRDFKPDNVLVDKRGRVCVTDFGLARASAGGPDGAPAPPSARRFGAWGAAGAAAAGLSLTRTGAVLGTPLYMAPEQHRGEPADAKSDQFGFCVALYEALYGRPPFGGETWRELAASVAAGELREPPARAGVPPRVQKALARGLSADPQRRFATVTELLRELSDDAGARRRRATLVGGIAALGLAAAAAAHGGARRDEGPNCREAGRGLEGVWGAGQKAAVRDALLRTGKPFAPDAWRGVERALDAYARDWAAARVDACEATHVRGEQSAEVLDRRMICLDERRKGAGALVEVLSRADGEVAGNAVGAALALAPVAGCADGKALSPRSKPPADAATAARLDALGGELERVKALTNAGKYREARALAGDVAAAAEALGGGALLGQALLRRGVAEEELGSADEAAATFVRAAAAADAAGDDFTRAYVAFEQVYNAGVLRLNVPLASAYNEQSKAALARLGGDAGLDGLRARNFGNALVLSGRVDEALAEFRAAQALLERAFGPGSSQAQTLLDGFSEVYAARGDYDAALATAREAVDYTEAAFGPRHPDLAGELNNLGDLLLRMLRPDEARAASERALAVAEDALGPDAPELRFHLISLADALVELGQHERAARAAERALAIGERQGDEGEDLLLPLRALGRARLALGEPRRAAALLERALRLPASAGDDVPRADVRFALARALVASGGDRRRARALAADARDAYRTLAKSPLERRRLRDVEAWLARGGR